MRPTLTFLLLTSWLLLSPGAARADRSDEIRFPGCDYLAAGLGPVIGWSFGGGIRDHRLFGGFEATGGCPWLRLSVGGTYRRAPRGQRRESVYWAAWEPGLLLGPTIGVSHSSQLGVLSLLGGWTGGAFPVTDELHQRGGSGGVGAITDVCVSLTVGVHVRFGAGVTRSDWYVAPKVQYCVRPDFFT